VAKVKGYKFGEIREHFRGEEVGGKGVSGEIEEKKVFETIENVGREEGEGVILKE